MQQSVKWTLFFLLLVHFRPFLSAYAWMGESFMDEKETAWEYGLYSSGTVAGSCNHSNATSGSIQSGNFLIGRTPYMSSHTCTVFHSFALVLIHLVLLVSFVTQIFTSSSILVPRMCVLHHHLYCLFFGYLPPNLHGLKWISSCVNLTGVVQ
jgi:hypothetical protein